MGYDLVQHTIMARLSRHNDPERDGGDDAAWDEYLAEVERLQHDPRFARIFDNQDERETDDENGGGDTEASQGRPEEQAPGVRALAQPRGR